jgi:hypothetical protein
MAADHDDPGSQRPLHRRLWWAGSASLCLYIGLLTVSFQFDHDAQEPPILLAVGLLAAATVVWLLALVIVFRNDAEHILSGRRALRIVLGFAVTYRLLLLPSWPIQETDYYRYLWDGRVTLHGHNPYQYSPYQVDTLPTLTAEPPADLAALGQLANQSETLRTVFDRVHHRAVPTAYPPAAQAVFAVSAALSPADAPLWLHILIWKTLLLAFDLGTLGLLILLLRRLGLPASWCLAYAWCPLALKEVANSGHFDAIAIFFTTLAALALVSIARNGNDTKHPTFAAAFLATAALALGILAKTYPLVLIPVVSAYLVRRLGGRALAPVALAAVLIAAAYVPFAGRGGAPTEGPDAELVQPNSVGTGLGTFLAQWEMNDFLFMLVRENLRPPATQATPGFVVIPSGMRQGLYDGALVPLADAAGLSVKTDVPLVATQFVMGLILLGLCLRWAWRVYRQPEPTELLHAIFLTLAWAWLLSAAQNPWYLLWCLPFMIFAGRRAWFLLPGLVLLYYVRFWVETHSGDGTAAVFDYHLIWLEYLPFFAVLAFEALWRRDQGPKWEGEAPAEPLAAGDSRLSGGLALPDHAGRLIEVGAVDIR